MAEHTVFLLGIFTTSTERTRRDDIRETYLKWQGDSIVCTLRAYLSGVSQKNCVIVYAFVLGGNPSGHTFADNSEQLEVLPETLLAQGVDMEADVIYLNIKENMNHGKTPTWFKYASSLCRTKKIDYVGKIDSDTFLHIDSFVTHIHRDLPPRPSHGSDGRKRYGGLLREYNSCGSETHCKLLEERAYMSGQFYYVSSDVADFISQPKTSKPYVVGFEDIDFSFLVFAMPEAINLVVVSSEVMWLHNADTKSDIWWKNMRAGSSSARVFPFRGEVLTRVDECLSANWPEWSGCAG